MVDPSPINNPGKYIDDGKVLVLVPTEKIFDTKEKVGTLNTVDIIDGERRYRFAPLGLSGLGLGRDAREGVKVVQAEYFEIENREKRGNKDSHRINYEELAKRNSEIMRDIGAW